MASLRLPAAQAGARGLAAQISHHHEAGIFLSGYPTALLTRMQKSPMPLARAQGRQ